MHKGCQNFSIFFRSFRPSNERDIVHGYVKTPSLESRYDKQIPVQEPNRKTKNNIFADIFTLVPFLRMRQLMINMLCSLTNLSDLNMKGDEIEFCYATFFK